jgi:CRISPR-associated protein Cas2
MDVLVAYDIADTQGDGRRRLQEIANVCTAFGTRVQFSVFECRLSPEAVARLIGQILDVIDAGKDSVLIYRFDGPVARTRTQLGRKRPREVDEPWII